MREGTAEGQMMGLGFIFWELNLKNLGFYLRNCRTFTAAAVSM